MHDNAVDDVCSTVGDEKKTYKDWTDFTFPPGLIHF